MDIKEAEPQEAATQTAETPNMEFPKPAGQGFSQYDPGTGWIWIGLHAPSFQFRDAWAFIKSQGYLVSSVFTKLEKERMMRSQLANAAPKAKGNIAALAQRLGLKV